MRRPERKRIAGMLVLAAIGLLGMMLSHDKAWAKNDTEVYIAAKDLSNTSRHAGDGIVEAFLDQFSNGIQVKDNLTLLLEKPGDYVEYDIDLADSAKSATLKVHGYNAAVWVVPAGGEPIALKPANGGLANRGVNLYALTEKNALSGAGNQFAVRIGYSTGTVVLNAIYVQTTPAELSGAYSLDPLGKSYLQHVYDLSSEVTRYFDNEKYPTLHIPKGKFVTMAFDYADSTEDLTFEYDDLGEALVVEMSADLTKWSSVTAHSGKVSDYAKWGANKKIYVRFSAKSGDSFLKTLKLNAAKGAAGGSGSTPAASPDPVASPPARPSPGPGTGQPSGSAAPTVGFKPIGGKDQRYVYLPIKDLSNASRYDGKRIMTEFLDTYEGGNDSTVNPTLLLQDAGEYVEYDLDLVNGIKQARLKVNMKDGIVSVKAAGGTYVRLKAVNDAGSSFDRSVAVYELTEKDALSDPERRFTVRIESSGVAVVLNSLLVETDVPTIAGTYSLKPLGESYMKHVYNVSQRVTRYFYNSVEPTVFIRKGGQVTLQFGYGSATQSFSYAYANVGEPLTAEASVDGKTWVSLGAAEGQFPAALAIGQASRVYVRFTANIGDSFLQSFTLKPEATAPKPQAPAESVGLPANQSYVYFKVGTAEEKKYMFGTGAGGSNVASFESTHAGMDYDGFEGGYNTQLLPPNARVFNGQSVTYAFDLQDSLKTAQLKINGLAGMKFAVAPDGQSTFKPLTTSYAPSGSGRGYYLFNLNESNALAAGNNKFRLMISGDYGVLFEVMIASGPPAAVRQGVLLAAQTEPGLAYLAEAKNTGTYYAHERFANYLIGGERGSDSYLLYRVDVAGEVKHAVLFATFSGAMTIGVSSEKGGTYTPLIQSDIGGSGTPPTNTADLSEFLDKGRTLYIKVSGKAQQGFLDSLGIAVTPADALNGAFGAYSPEEASYLYTISNSADGYGQSTRQHEGTTKLRSLDAGGEAVYKIDLPDDYEGGVAITVQAVEGQSELLVSADGAEYRSVYKQTQKDAYTVQEYEALADNSARTLYLKLINPSESDPFVFKGLSYTTDNVAPLRQFDRPATGDFDYGNVPTGKLAGFPALPDPGYGNAVQEDSRSIAGWNPAALIAIIAGLVLLLAGGGTFLYMRKRQRGGKGHG